MADNGDTSQGVVTHGEFAQYRDSTNRQLGELKDGQDRTNENIVRLGEEFRRGLREASERQPTNWGWVLGGVSFLALFVGLYVTPVRTTVEELAQRLWNIETSRYSVDDGKDLRNRMETRDDFIIEQIRSNEERAWSELANRAKWMGGADRDISENAHELDLLWVWRHEKADTLLDKHEVRIGDIERRLDAVLNIGVTP